ncbi:DUF2225 domain-containing protein [Colwellia echini]|nr:DUF2225 domain-containing protein [Colwellia echini]
MMQFIITVNIIIFMIMAFSASVQAQNIAEKNSSSSIELTNSSSTTLTQVQLDEMTIALTYIARGNTYYQEKKYQQAIAQYSEALKHLVGNKKAIEEQLAITYHQIAQSYKHLKDTQKSINFYIKALTSYSKLQNQRSVARTLNNLAMAERYRGNYVSALDYSTRGLEIHKQIDDPLGYAKALTGAGRIYRFIGRYEKSLDHIHQAHLYYKKENDVNNTAETSNQMGLIYTKLKQFDQARSFYQLTIDLPKNKVETKTRAAALRELAVIDLNAGDYSSAMLMIQQANQIYKKENEKSKVSLTDRVIGNIYRDQKDNRNAIIYYRKALSLAIKINDEKNQIKALNDLGRALIDINTDEAVIFLIKALNLSIKLKNRSETLEAYRSLKLAEKSRGNISKSLYYAEEEISLSQLLQKDREKSELVIAKANIHSHKIEIELASLKEKTRLVELELVKKNNEIEIAEQTSRISELELTKNRYASFALTALLVICILAVIFIYHRFIDFRKRNKELRHLASRDPLTNCFNRRILFELLERDFSDVKLLGEYCIIMVDIDHFKSVNDTYGHSAGDTVLRGVANILQDGVRQNDIVARYGGEEFCLVLPGAEQDQAVRIAESIRENIESTSFDDITVTASFGVTAFKFNTNDAKDLIDQADIALYTAKTNGRNQVILWNKDIDIN